MQDAKTVAVKALLAEQDGELLVVLPTIESLSIAYSPVDEVSHGNSLFSWLLPRLHRFLAVHKAEVTNMGMGGTIALTTNGIVLFVNDREQLPHKRAGIFHGYDKIGSATVPDMLTLQLDGEFYQVRPSQRENLTRILQIAKADA